MIEEIGLIALAIYLLRKGTPDYKLLPPGKELHKLILTSNNSSLDYLNVPDHMICPWFWKKRPAIFNVVPINPKSRKNWRTLCDIWREIRLLGLEIKRDEAFIPAKSKEEDVSQLKTQIKNAKNRQAFLLKETKRLADMQKRYEALYVRSLKNTFSEDEIKDFYLKRKKEIEQGIWPRQNTQVVPIVSPGGGSDKTAIDVGPIEPGSSATQMGSPTDRSTWEYPNVEKKNYQTKVPVRKRYNERARNQDLRLKAKPPGKRISKSGNVYYERRVNRSDYVRKNADGSNWYM